LDGRRRPVTHGTHGARRIPWHGFGYQRCGGNRLMLQMALTFLVIGIIAALLGFTTIAGASIAIAKFLAGLFLLLFIVFLVLALVGAKKIID
jgi:uncharacterized membrane protein YtjA (UPF0391 family)